MTFVYSSDRNYVALTAISAVSALRYNPGARIVLLGYNLESDAREIVRLRVCKAGGEFVYCDISAALEQLKEKGYNGYTSYAAYARIFIPQLLNDVKRVLYVDGDTLFNGSAEELFDIDLCGKPFALGVDCVPYSYCKVINMSPCKIYFNSGVMLIDLDVWRSHNCTERFLNELQHPAGPNPLGDQDIFCRVFNDEIALLPPKWNFISHFFLFSYNGLARVVGGEDRLLFSRNQYSEAHKDPRIYHFLGNTLGRPWYTSSRHPMREAYRAAAKSADLAEYAEQTKPMLRDYVLQYNLHKYLPQTVFEIVCNWLYRINIWRNYHV